MLEFKIISRTSEISSMAVRVTAANAKRIIGWCSNLARTGTAKLFSKIEVRSYASAQIAASATTRRSLDSMLIQYRYAAEEKPPAPGCASFEDRSMMAMIKARPADEADGSWMISGSSSGARSPVGVGRESRAAKKGEWRMRLVRETWN